MKKLLFFVNLFTCCLFLNAKANVFVGAGTGGTNICSNRAQNGSAPAYTTLGNIGIVEQAAADITMGPHTLVLTAPTGWEFNTASPPTYSFTAGRNITSVTSPGMTTTTLTVNVVTSGTTLFDVFTIIGLQVQATTTLSTAGSIRATAAAGITGIVVGAGGTNFANLSLAAAVTPTVSFSQTPTGPFCAGTNVTFTATPVNGGTPTYQWMLNGTAVAGSTLVSYSSNSLANGNTVTVTMNSTVACVTTSTATATVSTMTVNPLPAALTGTLTVCENATTALSSTSGGGTWLSSAPAVASVNTSGGVTGVSAVPVTTANITYTLPTGCRTTAQVTVNPAPSVWNVTGGGSFCASGSGVNVGLSGSVTGIDYNLSDGTSTVATVSGSGSALNFGLFSTGGTYTADAVNTVTGCTRAMAMSAIITVATPVTPSVSITSSSSLICNGSSATFTAIPVNPGISPTYQWYVNGTPFGTGTTYNYMPVNGDVVTVTLHPGGICTVPDSATIDQTVVVTPMAFPGVSISVNPGNPSCQGSPVTFSATPSAGGTTPAYRWTKNGVNVATGPSYVYTPANGDVVFCMLTSSYACRAADTALSTNTTMTVQASAPLPVVGIAATPSGIIAAGETVTFTAIVSGVTVPVTYQWILNGTAIAGATNATYSDNTFINADIVTCKVTNTDPCERFTLKSVLVNSSATGLGATSATVIGFTLTPNPNYGEFMLQGPGAEGKETSIRVLNLLGQSVFTRQAATRNGMVSEQVRLENLPAGIYVVDIRSEAGQQALQFVKN